MTIKQKTKQADLTQHPKDIAKLKAGTQLTIGDLHGNAMKLIYFLISEGVMKLSPPQKKRYKELYEIYNKLHGIFKSKKEYMKEYEKNKSEVKKYFKQFKEILDKAKFTQDSKNVMIRLIGDDIADRGANDYLTFLVMNKLNTAEDLDFKVLCSNYGADGLRIYEQIIKHNTFDEFKKSYKANNNREFKISYAGKGSSLNTTTLDSNGYLKSMHGLLIQLESGNISMQEFKRIYKKSLLLIDYSISEDGKLSIYTHAPIDLNDIRKVAKYYKIKFKPTKKIESLNEENLKELTDTFDSINKKFQEQLQRGETEFQKVIEDFIWQRADDRLSPYTVPKGVKFIHGHEGQSSPKKGFINLDDSALGKYPYPKYESGIFPILVGENERSKKTLKRVNKTEKTNYKPSKTKKDKKINNKPLKIFTEKIRPEKVNNNKNYSKKPPSEKLKGIKIIKPTKNYNYYKQPKPRSKAKTYNIEALYKEYGKKDKGLTWLAHGGFFGLGVHKTRSSQKKFLQQEINIYTKKAPPKKKDKERLAAALYLVEQTIYAKKSITKSDLVLVFRTLN